MEAGVREASQRLAEDFAAMKLKVGFGVEADIEYASGPSAKPWGPRYAS